jgi:hypothetical protein
MSETELAKKWGRDEWFDLSDEFLADLTAHISEYYYPKEEYDKIKDELELIKLTTGIDGAAIKKNREMSNKETRKVD